MQFEGLVVSDKAKKTVIVEVNYNRFVYKTPEVPQKEIKNPRSQSGLHRREANDTVNIAETRRLSKTKSFVVTNVVKK